MWHCKWYITYLHFLQNKLPKFLEKVNIVIKIRMWWHQDALPHCIITEYLNEKNRSFIKNRWWEGGYIWRLPHSLNLTSPNFFVGLHKKYCLQNRVDIYRRYEKLIVCCFSNCFNLISSRIFWETAEAMPAKEWKFVLLSTAKDIVDLRIEKIYSYEILRKWQTIALISIFQYTYKV